MLFRTATRLGRRRKKPAVPSGVGRPGARVHHAGHSSDCRWEGGVCALGPPVGNTSVHWSPGEKFSMRLAQDPPATALGQYHLFIIYSPKQAGIMLFKY